MTARGIDRQGAVSVGCVERLADQPVVDVAAGKLDGTHGLQVSLDADPPTITSNVKIGVPR